MGAVEIAQRTPPPAYREPYSQVHAGITPSATDIRPAIRQNNYVSTTTSQAQRARCNMT